MILRILLSIFLVIGLTGCATMKRGTPTAGELQLQISDLEKKIQDKDNQIQTLESKLDEVQRSQEAKAIRKTSGKATTKEIQAALKNAGYYQGVVDGKAGNMTKSAIKTFQKDNGLKEDGVVGQQTWMKLSEYLQ